MKSTDVSRDCRVSREYFLNQYIIIYYNNIFTYMYITKMIKKFGTRKQEQRKSEGEY